ncbi:hypothetical protein RJ641_018610 [Dillenia turbinata]|uniref:Uncharacterized protein n=1 Tax=Dillenia turbinata TaxID=194707 RepID=A0AAN8UPA5_9MAGN
MASIKSTSRYTTYDSRSSLSDPSLSTELRPKTPTSSSSRALLKSKLVKNNQNFTSLVKKFMDKKSMPNNMTSNQNNTSFVPADFIDEDLKKTARKGTNFAGLHKKLFSKGSSSSSSETKTTRKALTGVKENTRTLAVVLRSERELLSQNKELDAKISELKLMIEEKNREVARLKDLCLKQRDEIKGLKSAILFPDVMNSQLQEILERQGWELKQAKQVIPNLQRQVSSLSGQLQYLADGLAEVKAEKYSASGGLEGYANSPSTPSLSYEQEALNSLVSTGKLLVLAPFKDLHVFLFYDVHGYINNFTQELSSEDPTTPASPDDMFLKDLNPGLTPYYPKTKSKEFEMLDYDPPPRERGSEKNVQDCREIGKKLSGSSDQCKSSFPRNPMAGVGRRTDESKLTYERQMYQKLR